MAFYLLVYSASPVLVPSWFRTTTDCSLGTVGNAAQAGLSRISHSEPSAAPGVPHEQPASVLLVQVAKDPLAVRLATSGGSPSTLKPFGGSPARGSQCAARTLLIST